MAFKMKGSSLYGHGNSSSSKHTDATQKSQAKPGPPGRKQKKKDAAKRESYNATLDAVTPNMTDDQLRDLVLKQHGGEANKWNVNINTLKKIRSGMQSETPIEPVEPSNEYVEVPSTYGERRQDFVSTQLNPDVEGLSDERKAQMEKDVKSGYQGKLTQAIINKYGKLPHELTGQDRIDAGNAMIDKDGNILPMSSIRGQFTDQDL
mgnify:FL=1|tara:strand:+ start:278 stop:895 length:618 start_codon:yes stop_codon:yes gene_type:complete